jgi:hypothetical protein
MAVPAKLSISKFTSSVACLLGRGAATSRAAPEQALVRINRDEKDFL